MLGVGPNSPADNNYQSGFATALMLKDLRLAVQAAEESGTKVPVGATARELYESLVEQGDGGRDFSILLTTLRSGAR